MAKKKAKMTAKSFIEFYNDELLGKLFKAVYKQFDCDNFKEFIDMAENITGSSCGIAGGYHGFVYYNETCSFYERNKELIWEMIDNDWQEIGYNSSIEMLKSFNCFKALEDKDFIEFLQKGKNADCYTTIANGLTWYAAEEVCRKFESYKYEFEND